MTKGRISVQTAAKVLKMDAQTVRLLLRQGVEWGLAYKRPGSNQYSYLIYAEPFGRLTGYQEGDEKE